MAIQQCRACPAHRLLVPRALRTTIPWTLLSYHYLFRDINFLTEALKAATSFPNNSWKTNLCSNNFLLKFVLDMEIQERAPGGGVMRPPPSFLIRSFLIRLISNSLTSNSFTLVQLEMSAL